MLLKRGVGSFFLVIYMIFSLPVTAGEPLITFGFQESQYSGLKPFPKWRTVLERFEADQKREADECLGRAQESCSSSVWTGFLDKIKNAPHYDQLVKVNQFANSRDYITDPINWGVDDYWETPDQFLSKFGDCEDYAIIKYLSLRALGWPVESMKIVILHDSNLEVAHANLVVDLLGRRLVLDNLFSQVIEQSRIHHYKPIYAVNEKSWWRFSRAKS